MDLFRDGLEMDLVKCNNVKGIFYELFRGFSTVMVQYCIHSSCRNIHILIIKYNDKRPYT